MAAHHNGYHLVIKPLHIRDYHALKEAPNQPYPGPELISFLAKKTIIYVKDAYSYVNRKKQKEYKLIFIVPEDLYYEYETIITGDLNEYLTELDGAAAKTLFGASNGR